jgi:hypothetical protein
VTAYTMSAVPASRQSLRRRLYLLSRTLIVVSKHLQSFIICSHANAEIQVATVSLMICATAEIAITIIAASLPVLRVFIKNTIQSTSSQDKSHNTDLSHNISGFELLTPSSLARTDATKESEFNFQLNDRSSIPKREKVTSKSTDNSWLSSASQSRLELQGHDT